VQDCAAEPVEPHEVSTAVKIRIVVFSVVAPCIYPEDGCNMFLRNVGRGVSLQENT
jgi:hypothetical protein